MLSLRNLFVILLDLVSFYESSLIFSKRSFSQSAPESMPTQSLALASRESGIRPDESIGRQTRSQRCNCSAAKTIIFIKESIHFMSTIE